MSDDGTWTTRISESGNTIENIEARERTLPKGRLVFIPEGHAFYSFPVPAITDSATDDGAQILDHIAGPLRGAAAHVQDLIDHDERNDIDG